MTFGISNDEKTQEIIKNYPLIEEFCIMLHGSGIDYDYYIEENEKEIKLFNAFHCMNENGYYVTSQNFTVTIPKKDIFEFTVKCPDKNRYWWNKLDLQSYLAECISQTLNDVKNSFLAKIDREKGIYPISIGIMQHEPTYEIFKINKT
jgi:hypothetical protein